VPFLIDSNVLIDVSRGNVAAIKYADTLPEPWSISQVTAMELIVGARDKHREYAAACGGSRLWSGMAEVFGSLLNRGTSMAHLVGKSDRGEGSEK
jgi:predicted nucleic acid-binding protein